jgi:SH3 domain-containing protein
MCSIVSLRQWGSGRVIAASRDRFALGCPVRERLLGMLMLPVGKDSIVGEEAASAYPAWFRCYGSGVNIRTSPDVNATSVGQLQYDDRILVTAEPVEGGEYAPACGNHVRWKLWYPVDHFGQIRYVVTQCLERV